MSQGASEQRAWGRAPGIVGDQARGGSREEPDSGRVEEGVGGVRRPASKREEGSAPLSRGRSAGPRAPKEGAHEEMTLGAGQAETGVSLGTPGSPHPRAAAGRAGSGPVSLLLQFLLAAAEGGKMAPAPASPLKGPETPAGKSHHTGPAPHGQPIITSTNSNPPSTTATLLPRSPGQPPPPRRSGNHWPRPFARARAGARVTRATTHLLPIP